MSFKRLTEINFSNVAQFGDVGFGFLSVCCYILYYLIILEFPFPFFSIVIFGFNAFVKRLQHSP